MNIVEILDALMIFLGVVALAAIFAHAIMKQSRAEDEVMMVRLSTVRAAIDLEPELPGEMPDEMWEAIRNDRDAMMQALRVTVMQTKIGIKSRLDDFINEGM